ncbi:MAG: transcriptional repressor [Luteolibacter sp.]
MAEEDSNDFLRKAESYWRAKNGHMTRSRRVVCTVLQQIAGPIELAELHERAKRLNVPLTHATAYRMISDLLDADLLIEVQRPGSQSAYLLKRGDGIPVCYLICPVCHRITLLEEDVAASMGQAAMIRAGYDPSSCQVRIESRCTGACRQVS